MPRRRLSPAEKDKLTIASALLFSQRQSQAAIAERLDISQATVSRLIRRAQELGWLAERPALHPRVIGEERLASVEAEYLSDPDLEPRLLGAGQQSDIRLDVRSYPNDMFELAAGERVANLLARSRLVGVLWGRTIRGLIESLAPGGARGGVGRPDFRCIPLCGDPLFLMNQSQQPYSASRLAEQLEQIYTGVESPDLPSLSGVPAYVGRQARGGEDNGQQLRRFVESIPGFQRIFGSSSGAGSRPGGASIDRVDTILTGVGSIPSPEEPDVGSMSTFIQERIEQEPGLDVAELRRIAWGDMGGLLLGRRVDDEDPPEVHELNAGWMGLELSHYARLAKRATEENLPGVILLAAGAAKAPTVVEAVRRGYVNEVLCDRALGDEVRELAGAGEVGELAEEDRM